MVLKFFNIASLIGKICWDFKYFVFSLILVFLTVLWNVLLISIRAFFKLTKSSLTFCGLVISKTQWLLTYSGSTLNSLNFSDILSAVQLNLPGPIDIFSGSNLPEGKSNPKLLIRAFISSIFSISICKSLFKPPSI